MHKNQAAFTATSNLQVADTATLASMLRNPEQVSAVIACGEYHRAFHDAITVRAWRQVDALWMEGYRAAEGCPIVYPHCSASMRAVFAEQVRLRFAERNYIAVKDAEKSARKAKKGKK